LNRSLYCLDIPTATEKSFPIPFPCKCVFIAIPLVNFPMGMGMKGNPTSTCKYHERPGSPDHDSPTRKSLSTQRSANYL